MTERTRPPATAAERDLVALGRQVVEQGLVVAAGGNISVRRDDGLVAITPSGASLAGCEPATLPLLDGAGTVVHGGTRPSSELAMHVTALRLRPDARVVLHLHPATSTLLHVLGVRIRHFTTDHAYYLRDTGLVDFFPPGSAELARAVGEALGSSDVVLLRNHGCLVVADSVDLALSRAANLEAAAAATVTALRLGDTDTTVPDAYLAGIRAAEAAAGATGYGPRG